MRKLIFMLVLCLVVAGVASAQKVDVFGGYSYVHTNGQIFSSNLNGGSASIAYNLNHSLGIVADFGGYHGSVSSVGFNVFTYMFGPKFSYHHGPITPFAHALFGGAHGSASGGMCDSGLIGAASPATSCGSSTANAFAMAIGGGVDAKVASHVSVRLIQAEYVMTRFFSMNQNSARISTGVVFRF